MSKLILVNNIKNDKQAGLESICKRLNIKIKKVPQGFLGQPLGFLAQVPGMKKVGGSFLGSPIEDEVIVFSDFDDADLDEFLAAYKESGMEPIELKAVVTPTNQNWTFVELYNELVQERNAYRAAQMAVQNTI